MKTPTKLAAAGILMMAAAPALAAELSFDLRADTARLGLHAPLTGDARRGGTALQAGALLTEKDDQDALVAHLGFLVHGDAGAPRANVEAAVGVRAVALDADPDISGSALTVGGQIAARVPEFDRVGFSVAAFYAPGITAFGELDEYLEYSLAIDYQLIRRAFLYLGFRQLKIDVNNSGVDNLDTGYHGGIRLRF